MYEGGLNDLNRLVDISAVRTDVTLDEINLVIKTAIKHNLICAFAMPYYTATLVERLSEYPKTLVGGVIGFPSGADTTDMKVKQVNEMLTIGVDELDMVMNVGAMKSGEYGLVYDDIKSVVVSANGKPVKCILETCYLNDSEIAKASEIAVKAGVAFIKTGTGWGKKPTTVEMIKIIKNSVGDAVQIKAAGGIRDLQTINEMYAAGCTRFGIGVHTTINIFNEITKNKNSEEQMLKTVSD